jgi:hypothetical protein
MLTAFAIRNWSWSSSSQTTASTFASSTRHTLCQGRISECQTTFVIGKITLHRRDGTMILVRCGIDHYSVPVLNLWQMKVTAISVNIGGRPVKLVAVYQSSLRSLLDADLLEWISRGTPVLLVGDLNATHKDWNSGLNSPREESSWESLRSRIPASSMDQIPLPLFLTAPL